MLQTSQFLHILHAEADHLVTVSITLPADTVGDFERRLNEAFASDSFSDSARAWNAQRLRVVQEAIEQHLLPAAVKWTREWLREEVEEFICRQCAESLREVCCIIVFPSEQILISCLVKRVDQAPYVPTGLQPGETPSVLALSWGKGDPHKDPIVIVFLDEAGRLREHTRIDNLVDDDNRDEFNDILKRRRPDVIVVGGFSMATAKLSQRVKELVNPRPDPEETWGEARQEEPSTPIIYVYDEVARLFQHSPRADEEFSSFSPVAKYCIGLARYAQNPLNEYVALGSDIIAINFDEDIEQQVSCCILYQPLDLMRFGRSRIIKIW